MTFKDNDKWKTVPLFWGDPITRTVDSDGNTTINHGVRTDLITVRLTVETVKDISAHCPPRAIACMTDVVYIQGEPNTSTILLNVQFVEWGNKPYYEDGTLYTYAYPSDNRYAMGLVGDLLAEAMALDIGFNRRASLGHEFGHVAGLNHAFVFPWSVNDGLR